MQEALLEAIFHLEIKFIFLINFFSSHFGFNKVPNHISFSLDIGLMTDAKLLSIFNVFFPSFEFSFKYVELNILSYVIVFAEGIFF